MGSQCMVIKTGDWIPFLYLCKTNVWEEKYGHSSPNNERFAFKESF